MFRLGHVTDPHFRGFDGARLGQFTGKRAIGAVNLVLNRRRKHKMDLLAALGDDVRAQALDHLAVTGDLSNIALEAEWQASLRWLAAAGVSGATATIIPGNHDAYVADVFDARRFETLFASFQAPDVPVDRDQPYPFVRLRGDVALIGVTSCVPTGDLGAWGEVGAAQLQRLEATLTSPALQGKTRVVLIHHPPVMLKGAESRNLRDRQSFADVLGRAGAELVLHGHDHKDESATLPGPGGRPIPIIGAGSASYTGSAEKRARYNIYEFDGNRITVVTRAHDEASDAFREVRRKALG
ncbi:MAG TPA: metallophosphoesterase [Polyangia bacterium]|jgi:3',5'-cyclic AMP phosphodiesterase CpdA|nr:metallophosphoesterase [Polyangia bacterium]